MPSRPESRPGAIEQVGAGAEMPLPRSARELTAEWLSAALSIQYPGVEVTKLEMLETIHGTSTKFRLRVSYNDAGLRAGLPGGLIVKGGFEEHSLEMGNDGMYLLEMRFYRDVVPFVDINVPACFYAGHDPAGPQSIVVLEDLTLRGADFCDAFRTQDFEQVAARLDSMARYHAATWGSPELEPGGRFDWVPRRYENERYLAVREHYLSSDTWDLVMDLPRAAAAPRSLRDRERLRTALTNMAAEHGRRPLCLIHGDTHLGNLYTDVDGTPGFIDAQVACAPWSVEVSYFVVGALEVVDRRRWEKALLAVYLERLKVHGVEDPPAFEEAWRDYRRDICHGFYIWLKNEDVFQPENVNTANTTRFGAAAEDCGTLELLAP